MTDYKNLRLTKFEDFATVLDEIGFMPFSTNCADFISLDCMTEESQWHTELPSDPWQWRTKIENEHRAIYGKIFDKKPGFISLEWLPYFLAARRKNMTFEEVYNDGLLSSYAKTIYKLFESNIQLATHEIKALGGFTKETNSKYENAMIELQMKMFITCKGTKQKIGKDGEPYGWSSIAYSTIEHWAGESIIEQAANTSINEAKEKITTQAMLIMPEIDKKKLIKLLGLQ